MNQQTYPDSQEKNEITIFLADDHPLLRTGLRLSIENKSGLCYIGDAENGFSAIEKIKSYLPDVALIDIDMPGLSGIEVIRILRKSYPNIKMLILSTYNEAQYVKEAMEAGADGYILKNIDLDELIFIIIAYYNNESVISAFLIDLALPKEKNILYENSRLQLSKKEKEILKCITDGKSNKEIACFLCVSVETVKTHIRHIYKKLNVKNRVEATQKFITLDDI